MSWSSRFGWPATGGRWSPFGSRSSTSGASDEPPNNNPVLVTDNDFSYIGPDDLDQSPSNYDGNTNGHQQQHHHHHHAHHSRNDTITLRHKSTRHTLSLPPNSISSGKYTVGNLREAAAREIDVPGVNISAQNAARRVRMFYKGRNLKDDRVRCADEGLSSGVDAEILCVIGEVAASTGSRPDGDSGSDNDIEQDGDGEGEGDDVDGDGLDDGTPGAAERRKKKRNRKGKKKGKKSTSASGSGTATPIQLPAPESFTYSATSTPPPGASKPPPSVPITPLTPLEKLTALSTTFRTTFLPQCEGFIALPPADKAKRAFEHKRLTETVLSQILLKLDAVETEGNVEARTRRKDIVREVQGVLTRLDEAA